MGIPVLQWVVRRETHSPRTAAAVVVLVLVSLTAVFAGTELVLHLIGARPVFAGPGEVMTWLRYLPTEAPHQGVIVGVIVAVVGAWMLWLAMTPGRRAKQVLAAVGHPVIVDNGVIASSLAEQVRHACDLSKGAVVVGIGHRSADVTVRPEPGQHLGVDEVTEVAQAALDRYQFATPMRVRARVLSNKRDEEVS